MYKVFHQYDLACAAQFQDSDRQSEGVVPQAVHLGYHELGRWQAPQHGVRGVQGRHQAALVRVATLPREAGQSELEKALIEQLLVEAEKHRGVKLERVNHEDWVVAEKAVWRPESP